VGVASLIELKRMADLLAAALMAAYFAGLALLWFRIRFGPERAHPSRAVQLVSRGFSAPVIIGFVLFGWTGDRWANGLLVALRVLLAIYVPVTLGQGAIVQIEPTCMRMGFACL
jgi:hypothetical protein